MNRTSSIVQQHTLNTPYFVGKVHCYSAVINGELILFDSGPPTTEAFDALNAQIDLTRLKYIFITHCHIDHYGLAPMIAERTGARILIPRLDAIKLQQHHQHLDLLINLLSDFGCDENTTAQIRIMNDKNHQAVQTEKHVELIEESDLPSQLGIKWLACPGHSQSDLVYLFGNEAICGDTLLQNIFQVPILDVNLQTFSGRFDNYNAYCESIKLIWSLQRYQIHPGHKRSVTNVKETILFYVKKLLELAAKAKKFSPDYTALQITRDVFGRILQNPFLLHMKLSEMVFARDFLEHPEKLKDSLQLLGIFEEIACTYHNVVE